jgi:hypothetical protein
MRSDPRPIAKPWTRVIVGPERGWCFREVPGRRVMARGEAGKFEADTHLRAAGFLLVDSPKGCSYETEG